ncbi:MAG TPA: hypothetical protein VJG83_01000 [archaeon]|nr:hypothetical protein [archaeon]
MRQKSIWWQASFLLKDKTFEKLTSLKEPRYVALLLVEFFLTMILVGAILLYLDGRFNTIEQPFNLFIFGAILFAVAHFYNYTSYFKQESPHLIRRSSSLKTLILEFVIFLIVLFSAYIYADPAIDILPYPQNLVVFAVALIIPLYIYINEKFINAQNP